MSRALLCLLLGAGGCDSLFEVRGTVTRCSDGAPLVGVRAQLALHAGVSDTEVATAYSSPDGSYLVSLNEPPDVEAVLRLDKPSFVTVEEAFDGAPSGEHDVCLDQLP